MAGKDAHFEGELLAELGLLSESTDQEVADVIDMVDWARRVNQGLGRG